MSDQEFTNDEALVETAHEEWPDDEPSLEIDGLLDDEG